MKPKDIKKYWVDIPVAPEDLERFKRGCAHYNMDIGEKRGSIYIQVGFDDPLDLYWLAANLFGKREVSAIAKWAI